MKIVRVDLFLFEIPLVASFRIATMECIAARGVFVRVRTDDEITGWGEATPLHAINGETQSTCRAALKDLAPVVLGEDPRDVPWLVDRMEHELPAQHAAASALEIAILDIAAKCAKAPLWRFLGGAARRLPTDVTIGIKSAEQARVEAIRIVEAGHCAVKVKLGSTIDEDEQRVRAVREAVGSAARIRVDANQGFARDDAMRLLTRIAPYDIEFCEQPVRRGDRGAMRYLNAESPIPIMADESVFSPCDARELIAERACSSFNVKLSKSRGLLRSLEIAEIAGSAGLPCMVGGMVETRLGVTAAAHVGAARRVFQYFDLDAHTGHRDDVIAGGIRFDRGDVVLSEADGLGAEPDPSFLRTLPVESIRL